MGFAAGGAFGGAGFQYSLLDLQYRIGGGSGCSAPIPPEAVSDSPQSSRASPTDRAQSLAARGLEHLQSVLLKYLVPQFNTRTICDELPCLFDVNHESAARQPLSLLLA